MTFENKKEIRNYILNRREKLDISEREEWDSIIFSTLINSEFYKKASVIFTFVSFKSEVDTHRFIKHALNDKKTICVPRIKSKEAGMEVYKIESIDDLKSGYFNILEPVDTCPEVTGEDIDLILMPGAAFDRFGGRVGYGKGFYDRYLSKIDRGVPKIALAYNFQVIDKVPMDEFDVKINGIITNDETILINESSL